MQVDPQRSPAPPVCSAYPPECQIIHQEVGDHFLTKAATEATYQLRYGVAADPHAGGCGNPERTPALERASKPPKIGLDVVTK